MSKFLILVPLALFPGRLHASCLVAAELCSPRSNLLYQWEYNILPEFTKNCGQTPELKIDWTSLRPIFKELQSNATASPCTKPAEMIKALCHDRPDIKVQTYACGYATERSLTFKNQTLTFLFNPDYRVLNKQTLSDEDLIKAELNKIFPPPPKPSPTPAATPSPAPAKTKPNPTPDAAGMTKRINDASAWFQVELAKIQTSTDTPQVKADKMNKLSDEFKVRMQKAQEAP